MRIAMHTHFTQKFPRVVNGKVKFVKWGPPPGQLKNHGALTSIRDEVRTMLGGDPPEPGEMRHMAAFSNGTFYDFRREKASRLRPSMMCDARLPFPYEEWSAPASVQ